MTLSQRASYIKGVIDGAKIDTQTDEGKIISLLSDLVCDMAEKICELQECNETLNAYIEEIDEDLGEVEELVYDDDDCCCDDECCGCDCLDDEGCCTCEYDCDDCDCDCDCDCEDDDDYNFFETVCPSCNEKVYLDESIDPSKIICPACFEEFSAATDN